MYTDMLQKGILQIEKGLNAVFSQRYNPFYYHGALPNFFLWVLFLSGLLLMVYYTPTLERAYQTVNYITHELAYGNAFRTVHRYAADGMMIFVMLHLFRVWFTDRYREYRILPWITGVVLLTLTFTVGLTGYVLIWDQDAVNLTYATLNLLKAFPLVGPSLAEWVMNDKIVSSYTLTMVFFLHLAIPGLLMFFLWFHYLRITRPVTDAPLPLNLLMLGSLFMVASAYPVTMGNKPDLNLVGASLELDGFYSWPQYLLTQGWSTGMVWVAVLAVPLTLLVLPYLQKKALRDQFAQVIDGNCTGCSLCYNDCPYEAIEMIDRNDPKSRFKRLAVVDAGRCSNCGLCVGACAFKAIEIPRRETSDVLKEIELALQTM